MARRSLVNIIAIILFSIPAAAVATPASALQQQEPSDTTKAGKKGLPLEPGRTLSYTATEGTWMSLDVSPDGFEGKERYCWELAWGSALSRR